MTVRTRILLACLAVALLPLIVFVLGARQEVRKRLVGQYERSVADSRAVITQDLTALATSLDTRLRALASRLDNDVQQRAALMGAGERAALLDWGASAMATADLDYLLLLDSAGAVLSSGHFRNEYDRRVTALPLLLRAQGPVLLSTRRAQGSLLALVRARQFSLGERRFTLVGGREIDAAFLARLARADSSVVVSLEYPGGVLISSAPPRTARRDSAALPFIDDLSSNPQPQEAQWIISHSLGPLQAILRAMDVWFLVALGAAVLLALLIARVSSARVNQPLEELAEQSERVNLERVDVGFATERTDEVGALARVLDGMVKRLRNSANQLRDAERRATVGEMARQVNHDIRNGLLPIRNVIQHLGEVARETPAELNTVFREREETLRSGVGYLESLAGNYARLSPRSERRACDVNAIVRAALRDHNAAPNARVELELSAAAPRVLADPVALRRTIENLAVNAFESLPAGAGTVSVRTWIENAGAGRRVLIAISDTGSGIAPDALERIFDDFYTTRERGSGLGLSIVRRLVADMDGRIHVQSEPGRGTTFRIDLPEAR